MHTLVDSSVWIQHFRKPDLRVIEILEIGDILIHSSVLGEIAAGQIKNRLKVLGNLKLIRRVVEIPPDEVLDFIETRNLQGKGLSWVDLNLLASCLASGCELLTNDVTLKKVFQSLK